MAGPSWTGWRMEMAKWSGKVCAAEAAEDNSDSNYNIPAPNAHIHAAPSDSCLYLCCLEVLLSGPRKLCNLMRKKSSCKHWASNWGMIGFMMEQLRMTVMCAVHSLHKIRVSFINTNNKYWAKALWKALGSGQLIPKGLCPKLTMPIMLKV